MTELLRSLGAPHRPAANRGGGVGVCPLLPWYGVSFAGLVRTPLGRITFVEVAIVLMLAATAYLIMRSERGPPFARPLHTGTLIALAGAWTELLVLYRILDRPDLGIFGDAYGVGLRYGIFIALGGGVLIVIGGLRCRRDELAEERDASAAREKEKTAPLKTVGE